MMIDKYVEVLQEEGRSESTIKNYKADVNHFVKHLGGSTGDGVLNNVQKTKIEFTNKIEKSGPNDDLSDMLSQVTSQAIRSYMDKMKSDGLSVSTVNRRLQSVRKLFAVMVDEGLIEHNPADGIKSKRVAKQNTTQWLEDYQVKEIFSVINGIKSDRKRALQRAIFSVLVNSGLRAQELCDIKLSDIDWDNGLLSVTGKGGKFRYVPFNNATSKNVQAWLPFRRESGDYLFQTERSDHMTVRGIEHMAQQIEKQLKFSFTVHQLRHTALKHIADTTGRIEIVASVAGHANVETSRRYIEPSLKEIGEAMKKTEFDF